MTTSGRDTPATRVNDTLPEGSGAAGVLAPLASLPGAADFPPRVSAPDHLSVR